MSVLRRGLLATKPSGLSHMSPNMLWAKELWSANPASCKLWKVHSSCPRCPRSFKPGGGSPGGGGIGRGRSAGGSARSGGVGALAASDAC